MITIDFNNASGSRATEFYLHIPASEISGWASDTFDDMPYFKWYRINDSGEVDDYGGHVFDKSSNPYLLYYDDNEALACFNGFNLDGVDDYIIFCFYNRTNPETVEWSDGTTVYTAAQAGAFNGYDGLVVSGDAPYAYWRSLETMLGFVGVAANYWTGGRVGILDGDSTENYDDTNENYYGIYDGTSLFSSGSYQGLITDGTSTETSEGVFDWNGILQFPFTYSSGAPQPQPQQLATPTGQTATPSATTATLSWTAVTNASSYNIQYKKQSASNWSSTTSSTASVTLSSLSQGTAYNWKVTAVGDGTNFTNSEASSVSSFTTKTQLATPSPTYTATSTTITATWSAIANANSYTIRYKKSTASSWSTTTSNTTSKTITGLSANTIYYLQVKASTTNTQYVDSSYSTQASVKTLTKLATPTGLSADQITNNSARVKWESVANATGYKVEYRETGSNTWIEG